MKKGMRHELKFYLPLEMMHEIRDFTRAHVHHDPHCASLPEHSYTVRSIYFDTEDLRFYFEKLDSVKIRKKLRLRTYNDAAGDIVVFMEIKRKFGRLGYKERLALPMTRIDDALNGKDPDQVLPDTSYRNRKVLERVRFLMQVKNLRPVVLVTYDREAFIGRSDSRDRVTFDRNIRSLLNPTLDQIFQEKNLKQFEDDCFVLELKFNESMPQWMTQLIRNFNLASGPYSKYCQGIDAWNNDPDDLPAFLKQMTAEG